MYDEASSGGVGLKLPMGAQHNKQYAVPIGILSMLKHFATIKCMQHKKNKAFFLLHIFYIHIKSIDGFKHAVVFFSQVVFIKNGKHSPIHCMDSIGCFFVGQESCVP
jgi:hypothetical protein